MAIDKFLLLVLTQTILSAVVAILSFIKYSSRRLNTRLIGFVFLTGCLANITSWLLVKTEMYRSLVNIPGLLYLLINLCLYSWLYYNELHKKRGRWFLLIVCVFVIFAIANVLFIQKRTLNSYTLLFHSGIVLTYSLLYFSVLIRDLPSLYVHHLPMFWFNSALLIFHAGTFFLFSFTPYLVNVLKDNLLVYWSFHNGLSIIEHVIFLIGLYYDFRLFQSKT